MTFDVEAVSSAYFLISRSEGSIDGGRDSHPWVRRIPWRREGQHALVLLPGESHGQRSPAGYSPWGRKASDVIERLGTTLPLPRIEVMSYSTHFVTGKGTPSRAQDWALVSHLEMNCPRRRRC